VNAHPLLHLCTYGACHLAIIPVSGRHRSTHITYNIIYELYTFYIICITHTIWYFIMIYDVMIHAHCTYGDRPPDGPLSLFSTERTFGRRCPFDFSGYFFLLFAFLLCAVVVIPTATAPDFYYAINYIHDTIHPYNSSCWPKWRPHIIHVTNN